MAQICWPGSVVNVKFAFLGIRMSINQAIVLVSDYGFRVFSIANPGNFLVNNVHVNTCR